LSTKRYSEKELRDILEGKSQYSAYFIKAKDKFGNYGIIGVLILKTDKASLIIDTLLLSCRALNIGIEDVIIEFVFKKGIKLDKKLILANYRETKKNSIVKIFLEKKGFIKKGDYFEIEINRDRKEKKL